MEECDVITPVPLHVTRLLSRRFNQSALLGQAIAQETGRPFVPDLLKRIRRTDSQRWKDYKQRRKNVRGAFEIKDRWRSAIAGSKVLLVDDVLTTGRRWMPVPRRYAGPVPIQVDVLTLARVVSLSRLTL